MRFNAFHWPGNFLVFLFILFFALSLRQLLDFDVWFQLLAGQETAGRMAVPRAEFYIYSALGEPSIFVGWLWGSLLYFAWLVGGYPLVSIFGALVWGTVFVVAVTAILARIAREVPLGAAFSRKAQMAAAVIGVSIAYQYLVGRAVFRAEVTLYLAWVLAIYLSVGITSDRQRLRRFLIAVPLLSWVLAWFHTTSAFMVLLLVGYLLQAAADAARQGGAGAIQAFVRTQSWPWLLSILAALVLPCLNPNGVQQALPLVAGLADALRGILMGVPGEAAPPLIHLNFEYRRLLDVPRVWPAAMLFFASSIIVVWRDRPHRVANALFLVVGILLSFLHIRALAVWGIFLMIPLGVSVAPWLHKATVVLEAKGRGALVSALLVMCCFWNVGVLYNREAPRWGIGYSPDRNDAKLLDEIRANLPEGGRIFNWHPLGAYLRWHLGQNYLVAMDGHFAEAKSPAWKAYFDIEDYRDRGISLIKKWNIQAVYHPVVVPTYGDIHWLPHELIRDRHWRLVAMDRQGVVFVRTEKEIDERTRNILLVEYWRRVVTEANFVALVSGEPANRQRARRTIGLAGRKITEVQALLQQGRSTSD